MPGLMPASAKMTWTGWKVASASIVTGGFKVPNTYCSEHGLFLKRADVSSTGGGAGMINGPDQWRGAGILGGPDMPGGRDLPGERDLLMSKSSKWRPIWGRFFALD